MRSRDPKLMKQIHDYINEFYIAEERTPTTTEIASAFSISRSSAYRYLVYLSENHDIAYEKGENTHQQNESDQFERFPCRNCRVHSVR